MGALNSRQFAEHGEQLAMFMSPREIIDNVHKVDSQSHYASPRAQWDDVAEEKLEDAHDNRTYIDKPSATIPPLHIEHVAAGRGWHRSNDKPQQELWDGHHRLAIAEDRGSDWLPVIHHDSDSVRTSRHDLQRLWGISGAHR